MTDTQEYAFAKRLQDDAVARGELLDGADLLDPVAWLKRDDEKRTPAYVRGRYNIGDLKLFTTAELCARVDARGPRKWLLRGIWPAGDYGVHAAEPKAQKTWNVYDLAISVASGTDWLGFIKVETPGPVLIFVGEGGEEETIRRMRAIAASKGLRLEDLHIAIVTRVPHLSNQEHLDEMEALIHRAKPVLVIVDPLYLAGRGANMASVYDMGGMLEGPQLVCQRVRASLLVVHHHNRKEGKGAARISGAGPAEWGRVLISAAVKSRHRDADTWETTVVTELDIVGGGIAGGDLRITRKIRTDGDEPDDLNAPLAYSVSAEWADPEPTDAAELAGVSGRAGVKVGPAGKKLIEALRAADGMPRTIPQLVDWIAEKYGNGLRRETCSRELNKLHKAGIVDRLDARETGTEVLWCLLDDSHVE